MTAQVKPLTEREIEGAKLFKSNSEWMGLLDGKRDSVPTVNLMIACEFLDRALATIADRDERLRVASAREAAIDQEATRLIEAYASGDRNKLDHAVSALDLLTNKLSPAAQALLDNQRTVGFIEICGHDLPGNDVCTHSPNAAKTCTHATCPIRKPVG